ncbi:hypothetical protein BDV34DRAFT_231402 [Aspergillus parasiticus]|uniref:Uncharacterized protein n=1 Tax=Aspergillus parasiticus TaxID=5067 RepID=A0A5N6D1S8_ASPPA|nr:hypothetical protein BDV34DRAFT_231402 [Aspergillus parasiticus]
MAAYQDPRAGVWAHPDIDNASQRSEYGYHHGMIPRVPPTPAPGEVNTVENSGWDGIRLKHARVHGGVCWVHMGTGIMCGQVFPIATSLYRHIRREHRIQMVPCPRGNIRPEEQHTGDLALRKYCRDQHWRHASFQNEPGRTWVGGPIDTMCNELESIAALDERFAAQYGTRFHRDAVPVTPNRGKRKGGTSAPPNPDGPPTPTPAEKRAHRGLPQKKSNVENNQAATA